MRGSTNYIGDDRKVLSFIFIVLGASLKIQAFGGYYSSSLHKYTRTKRIESCFATKMRQNSKESELFQTGSAKFNEGDS